MMDTNVIFSPNCLLNAEDKYIFQQSFYSSLHILKSQDSVWGNESLIVGRLDKAIRKSASTNYVSIPLDDIHNSLPCDTIDVFCWEYVE